MVPQTELSARQRRFVEAMAEGLSVKESARVAGVSESTGRRYATDVQVVAALRDAQDESLGAVVRRMNAGGQQALDVLESLMGDVEISPTVRCRAALGWLDMAFRAKELQEIVDRLAELEARLDETAA